ncbi:MAG: four-carbon acid sugar kinase family protein [Deltaproteobacteria bacterium]|nr:four-carbon acid sugar kinase family protein [Deltaproteobacteria bacterium]
MSLLLTFFGDDNTGSTDSMDALAKGGVNTVLFLSPPAPTDLLRFPGVQAVGVAGMTRTMPPDEMEEMLAPAFVALNALGAPLCHYKVCSTFDSSPHVGSIGRAIDVGSRVFGAMVVPLLVGAPALRRYTLFGNLFATVGPQTHRLDRHPTMSRHPVTPMNESDLRVHLAQQTSKRVGLFDILALQGNYAEVTFRFDAALAQSQAEVMLFDVLDEERLATAGELLWRQTNVGSRFVVGSSGVEYALVHAFRSHGLIPRTPPSFAAITPVKQVLVVSGSCSPVTQSQIDHALGSERGFEGFEVDAVALLDAATAAGAREAAVKQALRILDQGRSPLLYSARGPEDERIKRAEAAWRTKNSDSGGPGRALGEQLGMIVRAALERWNENGPRLQRVVVAGGDTSGHGARRLGVQALRVLSPTVPGAPLCRAYSSDPVVDGLQVLLKGGQVGPADFFTSIRDGGFR